jgi:Undecaprenyl-phosphate glucose phosphotransferase
MITQRSQLICLWFRIWDLVVTGTAWVLAFLIRVQSGWLPLDKEPPTLADCFAGLPMVLLVSLFAYQFTGQYQINRFRRLREEFGSVVKGSSLMILLVIAMTFGLQNHYESRATFLIFFALATAFILCLRRATWAAISWLRRRGFNQTSCVIVGTGRVARRTARALRRSSWMGIRNVGFVEDQPSRWCEDLDILGTTADLPVLIAKYRVSHVFISLPMNRYQEARKIFDILSQTLVDVRIVADVHNLAGLSLTTTNLDGLPVIGLRESPYFGANILVKRVMDVVLSLLAILILSPVMLVIAALVKWTSPGPIFYRQERCGLNGKTFQMLKFRSMRVDAEQTSGAVWAVKDDPRKTRFGSFLRKTSLDELPQFFNVLKGDMSLVGPRPERPVFIQRFSRTIPNYQARHVVKAGITGWAQVNGWRGNTSLRKRIQFDLYYITHWTPWLDIRILWLTLWHGLVNRNAY